MPARKLQGIIVSDKMDKTRVIRIDRRKEHAKYRKFYTVSTRLKAHDETNQFHSGDTVIIEETRPLSRDKRWRVIAKVEKTEEKK